MTSVNLKELKELLAEATLRPWKHIPGKRIVYVVSPECHVYSNRDNDDGEGPHHPDTIKRWNADAALIVAAVNALPALIARVEAFDWLASKASIDRLTDKAFRELVLNHPLVVDALKGGEA